MRNECFNLVLVLCLFKMCTCSPPVPGNDLKMTSKKFQNALNQQSLQTVILSIEERLKTLDAIYSSQPHSNLENKIDLLFRKIDSLESKLSRLESSLVMEIDKISENISSKTFKENLTKDHLVRKLDSMFDRLKDKFVLVELQLDSTEKKIQDKMEIVIARQQKLEDSLKSRDTEIQMEISDTIGAIDDMKTSCGFIEDQLRNATQTIRQGISTNRIDVEKLLHEKIIHIQENLTEQINLLDDVFYEHLGNLNKTMEEHSDSKDTFEEELNEYGNKLSNMYESLWEKSIDINKNIQTLTSIQNHTRSELQNGLRTLTVQLGRKSTKPNVNTESRDQAKLDQLANKIEVNLESIKYTQNAFLESCHRVQRDESQIETKISTVLERLLDILEERAANAKKDTKTLEILIKGHDAYVKRNNYQVLNTINTLLDKSEENRKRMEKLGTSIQNQMNDLVILFQDQSMNTVDPHVMQEILNKLKDMNTNITSLSYKMNAFKPNNTTYSVYKEVQNIKNMIKDSEDTNQKLVNLLDNVERLNREKLFRINEKNGLQTTNNVSTENTSLSANNDLTYNPSGDPRITKEMLDLVKDVFGIDPIDIPKVEPLNRIKTSQLNGNIVYNKNNTIESSNLDVDIDVRFESKTNISEQPSKQEPNVDINVTPEVPLTVKLETNEKNIESSTKKYLETAIFITANNESTPESLN